jgi:hypothetical protein
MQFKIFPHNSKFGSIKFKYYHSNLYFLKLIFKNSHFKLSIFNYLNLTHYSSFLLKIDFFPTIALKLSFFIKNYPNWPKMHLFDFSFKSTIHKFDFLIFIFHTKLNYCFFEYFQIFIWHRFFFPSIHLFKIAVF